VKAAETVLLWLRGDKRIQSSGNIKLETFPHKSGWGFRTIAIVGASGKVDIK
jgi:hypothetical protein